MEKPIFVLKPKIIAHVVLLTNLFHYMIPGLWFTIFFGGIVIALVGLVQPLGVGQIIGLFIALFVLFNLGGLWFVYEEAQKKQYRIYRDRIEYSEGFINVVQHTIYFHKITNVELYKGFFEKDYSLGTLVIGTAGLGTVYISNLENSEKWYQWISERSRSK